MSSFPPPQLKYKLDQVKTQEHRMARQALWRSCTIGCCAIGIFLLATLPYWQVKYQSQIKISGGRLVSQDLIFDTLDFDYPQFLWAINGINLANKIELIPSMAGARVNKTIFPPRLIISLQEKTPIAVATSAGKVGFLDAYGQWIPQEFYDNISAEFSLPKLKVVNYRAEYRSDWIHLYRLMSLHPELKTTELHWRQSGDLLLQTKIGKVFLGSDTSLLKQQFETMLKLRQLPNYIDSSKISYIDLSNPDLNLIQRY